MPVALVAPVPRGDLNRLAQQSGLQPHSRVLLAEDDFDLRKLLASALRRDGYDVVEIADGAELFQRVWIEQGASSHGSSMRG
jgi:PleD family two-component response regulator